MKIKLQTCKDLPICVSRKYTEKTNHKYNRGKLNIVQTQYNENNFTGKLCLSKSSSCQLGLPAPRSLGYNACPGQLG